MFPKRKTAVLLLILILLLNAAGCQTGNTDISSKPVSTSSEKQGDTGSDASDVNSDTSSDESSANSNTKAPVFVPFEDTYQTDRYIPTADSTADHIDESDNEIAVTPSSWDGPQGYVIVIPGNDNYAKESAELLKAYYRKNAGVSLNIVTDDTAAAAKEIVIGNTNRYKITAKEGEYFAKISGKKLIFGGGHGVTVKKAVQITARLAYKKGKAYTYSGKSDFTGKKFGYSYVWGDEFEGTSIDKTLWGQATKMSSTAEMALDNTELTTFLKNGYLTLQALRYWDAKKAGVQFVCPWSLTTMKTMSYKYGYVEIRARVPFVRGAWPSFWSSSSGALGPKRTADYSIEVDIFENFASLEKLAPNIHKWYADGRHTMWADETDTTRESYTFDSLDINDEYHIYGFEWTPKAMTMYIDDKPYYTYNLARNFDENDPQNKDKGASDMSGFDTQLYLIFNNHLFTESSSYIPYEGAEIYPTDLPTKYTIDWVRLYQKNDGISKLYTAN